MSGWKSCWLNRSRDGEAERERLDAATDVSSVVPQMGQVVIMAC